MVLDNSNLQTQVTSDLRSPRNIWNRIERLLDTDVQLARRLRMTRRTQFLRLVDHRFKQERLPPSVGKYDDDDFSCLPSISALATICVTPSQILSSGFSMTYIGRGLND